MSILHGVVIADPAKNNIKFNKIENDTFNVSIKQPGKPLGKFESDQDKFNNHTPTLMLCQSVGYSINECTIVMTTKNNEMIEKWEERRNNLLADVEKSQLEADKNLVDADINSGAWFDPSSVFPEAKFKQVDRPVLRVIREPSSRVSNPDVLAKRQHFLYVNDRGNFQTNFYVNNNWKDSKGRIHLFEKPFTRIW